jgi:predicted ATPase/class 3 adenylate cyclase/Tfp pilus assembly protein PilF
MAQLPTGTVTFLFTDIEGSTRLWEEHPMRMKAALARHDAILREAIAANGGYIFKRIGDAFCAAFDTAPQGVDAAIAAQRALYKEEWGEVGSLKVRMALHTGAAQEREGDYLGPTLDRITGLLPVGHGGETLLSMATEQLIADQLPTGVTLQDMGERRLRDLIHEEHIFQLVIPGLPNEFPPLRTLEGRPNNLPARTTPLIGREREVKQCCNLFKLGNVRLLTLTGPGGIGKTRLGLQIAAELLDEFPDGVFVVGLSPVSDPSLVASSISQALGVREALGQSLVQSLKDYLRGKQMLLVLDNFEQLLEAAPLVWELLGAAPGLRILVTSRAILHLSVEQEYEVPPLSLPEHDAHPDLETLSQFEAVALFANRAQAVKHDFRLTAENASAVLEICSRLEGLPLAIELAAARIKILPPQAMLARLDSRLGLLTGGGRDLPARQQTMRATIAWSYDLLEEGEQVLFRRLSIFVRNCTFEAAEAVANVGDQGLGISVASRNDQRMPISPSENLELKTTNPQSPIPNPQSPIPLDIDVLDGISSLVNKSLMRQVQTNDGELRFGMLETIRAFGLEKVAEAGEEDAIRERHAEFFLKLAEEAEPQLSGAHQTMWLDRLEIEHDNLRSAMEWANEHDQAELGLRLAAALWRFWYMRSYLSEGRRWTLGLLALPGALARTAARAKALNGAANLIYNQGDYNTAFALHEESLSISRELGDRRGVSASLNNLGLIARNHGEYAKAREYFEEALEINRAMGNRSWEAINLNNLGTVLHQQGDSTLARELQEKSLAIFTSLNDHWGISMALGDLGNVVADQAEYGEARRLYEKTLALQKELGDKRGMAVTLMALGMIVWKQGDYPPAKSMFHQSLDIFRDLGDKKGIATSLNDLGNVALYQGDFRTAGPLYEESMAIRKELGDKRDLAASHNNFGLLALEQGDFSGADPWLTAAVRLWREVGDKERISTSLTNLGRVALHKREFDRARAMFEESLDLSRQVNDKWSTAYSLSSTGQLAVMQGDYEHAGELFRQSLALRSEINDKRGMARSLLGLARVAWSAGQIERLVKLVGAAKTLMDAIGIPEEPLYKGEYDRVLSAVRAQLSEEKFASLWKEGEAMALDQAVAFALHAAPSGLHQTQPAPAS